MSKWHIRLLAAGSGAVAVLGFAPFSIWPLAIISVAVLFFLFLRLAPRQAVIAGYCYGLGLFGVGVSWVFNSIYEFGQAALPVAAILTVIFVLVLACFPALVALVFNYYRRAGKYDSALLVLPAIWVLTEWLRSWLFTGFPWLQLGYSQLHNPLSGAAPILGVLGVSWLAALVAVLIAKSFIETRHSRYGYLLSAVVVFAVGVMSSLLEYTSVSADPVKVTLVQGNIAQADKWSAEWVKPTIDRYVAHTVTHLDSRLVVWPEVALPGYYQQFQTVLQPVIAQAEANGASIITGMLTAEDNTAYNSIVKLSMNPISDQVIYRKRHLVPFGEYLPLSNLLEIFGSLVVLPAGNMGVGSAANLIVDGDLKIASSICYEDAFGNEMADMLPQANVLLNVSNDAWFGDSLAPHQHLEIAQMRALELGREMMRANNTGVTAFIDHRGRLRQRAEQFEVIALTGEITPRRGRTLYVLWKNYAVIGLMFGFLMFGWFFSAVERKPKNGVSEG